MSKLIDFALSHVPLLKKVGSPDFYLGLLKFAPIYVGAAAICFFVMNAGPAFVGKEKSLRSFVAYLLPMKIVRKKSFWVDLQIWLLYSCGLLTPVANVVTAAFFLDKIPLVYRALKIDQSVVALGLQQGLSHLGSLKPYVVFVIAFLAADLGRYVIHRLAHANKYLWQFHKAHHYGRQLNYLSNQRIHPIDNVIFYSVINFFMASAVCLLVPITSNINGGPAIFLDDSTWFYVAWIVVPGFVNRLIHSHLPIHYGTFWGRILVSPANHIIHHSREIIDKNFGGTFAFWDVLFKTYQPVTSTEDSNHILLNLGVEDMTDEHYANGLQWVVYPVVDFLRLGFEGLSKLPRDVRKRFSSIPGANSRNS